MHSFKYLFEVDVVTKYVQKALRLLKVKAQVRSVINEAHVQVFTLSKGCRLKIYADASRRFKIQNLFIMEFQKLKFRSIED